MKLEQVLVGTLSKRGDGEFVLVTEEDRTVPLEFRSIRAGRAADTLDGKPCEAHGTYVRRTFVVDQLVRRH